MGDNFNGTQNWLIKVSDLFKQFISESTNRPPYEVVDIFVCDRTLEIKVVIKLAERHSITKLLSDVIIDDDIIDGLDKKTVRTLTYFATIVKTQPTYTIIGQKFQPDNNAVILILKCAITQKTIEYPVDLIIKTKSIFSRLSACDAIKVGYFAGLNVAEAEERLKREQ